MSDQDFVYDGDVCILDPRTAHLRRDEFGRLTLEIGVCERHHPVRLLRCLPLSDPERFISVRGDDDHEIGLIRELAELDADSQRVADEELTLHYLKAKVLSVQKIERRNGLLCWEMETDLGPRTTYLRSRRDARFMDDGHIVLTDIHGGKFEMAPIAELDPRSRRWVEGEI